jgi:putative heme-binding domain-containing protein
MKRSFSLTLCFALIACITASFTSNTNAVDLELKSGDHIVYLGGGLADRMQHHGWLETYTQAAQSDMALVFRNHGYNGDTVTKRPRNRGFIGVDDYLKISKADVIFSFFGYNESFSGNPDGYAKDLAKWVDDTLKKDYSGKGAPRIVLFSPIAHENHNSPDLPDGKESNKRLMAYAHATQKVAQEKNLPFVDLFHPTLKLYAKSAERLTINGVHLSENGNREVARVIFKALFKTLAPTDSSAIEKLRQAVLDKNWHWFNRYRATDGNDVWGSRAGLKFTDKQSNGVVLMHELKQIDVLTANRDKVIWAAANGKTIKANDSNMPKAVPVKSNFTGKSNGKTGSLKYHTAQESVDQLTLPEGFQANVFASEEMFPELVNPVQLGFDTKGRVWAAAWKTYPKWEPGKKMDDRLLIFEDTNNDGVADKCKTFAYVHNPTGFEFWNGGVLVGSAPDIIFLKDTDGDDVADVRVRMLGGIDSSDTHHTMNNFVHGPGGWLYYQRGVFHVSNVETPWQGPQQSGTSGMYRYNPRTHQFSFHATNSPNPHGISFDYWGYQYATDGTGGRAYQVKHDGKKGFKMRTLLKKTVRPVPASGILSSAHFPDRNHGNFLICNAIGFLGIKQYQLKYNTETGDVNGVEIENFMESKKDRNFRPTDFEIGDDGAVYVSDWANAIVGHMQHNVRDPSRDHLHGRIIRVSYKGRPLSKHVNIDGQPIPALLDALKHKVDHVRRRARVELSKHPSVEVIANVKEWAKQFDPKSKADAHHLLEALWVYQQHNVVNQPLLAALLASPEPHARIAASRVKQFWDIDPKQKVKVGSSEHAVKKIDIPKGAIVIKTLPEMMRYDKKQFTVRPGAKVTLVFQNNDYMPHNLIIGHPGSASEIGNLAEAMGGDGFKKGFRPDSDKIIAATKMIDIGEHQILTFTVPQKSGRYDFLCTFPGHWQLMRGTMNVVAVGETLPEVTGPKFTEWTLKKLEPMLAHYEHGRDFKAGQLAFKSLGCAQCHVLGKEGGKVGPELNTAFKKWKGNRKDLLTQLLEPSKVVEDKYRNYDVETVDGRFFGVITERTKTHLTMVTNPQKPVPQKIALKDVDSIRPLKSSIMPKGILGTLSAKQILDLMAYIEAGGNSNHALYK